MVSSSYEYIVYIVKVENGDLTACGFCIDGDGMFYEVLVLMIPCDQVCSLFGKLTTHGYARCLVVAAICSFSKEIVLCDKLYTHV